MGCISFKEPREPLEVHLHLTAHFIDRAFLRRGYHKRIGDRGREVLLLAAILHDIGKGHKSFQSRGTFPGHELYSGYLVHRMVEEGLIELGDWGVPLSAAIALHHHTMKGRSVFEDFELTEECRSQVEEVIQSFNLEGSLNNLEKASLKEINEWLYKIKGWIRKPGNLKRVYLILYPLIIADNMAASIRGGSTLLSSELQTSYWPVVLYENLCNHPWLRRKVCP